MDAARGTNASSSAVRQTIPSESPEQLLDVFKAAALSVTKLYKTSALAESKARTEGYQDCLDDLLAFLDKGNIGLNDGEGWRVRRWATERLDGRDVGMQSTESEDEPEKAEASTATEVTRTNATSQQPIPPKVEPSPPANTQTEQPPTRFIVPTQENFTFQSSHQYPNIATLDLSDSRPHEGTSNSTPRTKGRSGGASSRSGPRTSNHLGRGAGNKRKMDIDEIFGGCLGGKDIFGNGGKRSRHT